MHQLYARSAWMAFLLFCSVLCLGAAVPATALEITGAMPKGKVRELTQITVRFSENMRPLGIMDEQAESSPLKLAVAHGALPLRPLFELLPPGDT